MTPLDYAADRQAVWSQTANMLKKRTDKVRLTVFGLSLAGAILAAIATQLPSETTVLLAGLRRSQAPWR